MRSGMVEKLSVDRRTVGSGSVRAPSSSHFNMQNPDILVCILHVGGFVAVHANHETLGIIVLAVVVAITNEGVNWKGGTNICFVTC